MRLPAVDGGLRGLPHTRFVTHWQTKYRRIYDGLLGLRAMATRDRHLSLSGFNAVLIQRGNDLAVYQVFRDMGYSDAEIRKWITQPAHQNWQLMGTVLLDRAHLAGARAESRCIRAQTHDALSEVSELHRFFRASGESCPRTSPPRVWRSRYCPNGPLERLPAAWLARSGVIPNSLAWPRPSTNIRGNSSAIPLSMTWRRFRRVANPETCLSATPHARFRSH